MDEELVKGLGEEFTVIIKKMREMLGTLSPPAQGWETFNKQTEMLSAGDEKAEQARPPGATWSTLGELEVEARDVCGKLAQFKRVVGKEGNIGELLELDQKIDAFIQRMQTEANITLERNDIPPGRTKG